MSRYKGLQVVPQEILPLSEHWDTVYLPIHDPKFACGQSYIDNVQPPRLQCIAADRYQYRIEQIEAVLYACRTSKVQITLWMISGLSCVVLMAAFIRVHLGFLFLVPYVFLCTYAVFSILRGRKDKKLSDMFGTLLEQFTKEDAGKFVWTFLRSTELQFSPNNPRPLTRFSVQVQCNSTTPQSPYHNDQPVICVDACDSHEPSTSTTPPPPYDN